MAMRLVSRAIPAPLHRALLRLAQRVRLRWWGLRRLEQCGTNALVFDPAGRLLLVRHSYHHPDRWLLPGGGMARAEAPAIAAAREVLEETACRVADPLWFATLRRPMPHGWTNRLELVWGTTADTPRADGRELLEAAFFALDALPDATAATTHDVITLWQQRIASERQ
ncbi:NUDIX domain-containing protein [Novosphingobium sp.]|uniref:NUDIX domain-containing protein n=1 Tax=Novosphingobium sp. TaxID=1874826 RepID=UPI0038B7FE7D